MTEVLHGVLWGAQTGVSVPGTHLHHTGHLQSAPQFPAVYRCFSHHHVGLELVFPRFSGRSVLKKTRNESSWSGPAAQDNLGSEAEE